MVQAFNPDKPQPGDVLDPDDIRNNFLSLVTSFSGPAPPSTPSALVGQLWHNTALQRLEFFDGVTFNPILKNQPHSEAANRDADDHPQYVLADGSRAMAGLTVTNDFRVDKIDLSTYADGRATVKGLLRNGSFETFNTNLVPQPPGWDVIGNPTLTTFSSAAGDDGKSLKITAVAGADLGVSQIINIKPGRRYSLSFFTKADTGNESRVRVEIGNTIATLSQAFQQDFTDTLFAYHRIEFSSSDKKLARISLLAKTSIGSIFYDEVQAQEGDFGLSALPVAVTLEKRVGSTTYRDIDGIIRDAADVHVELGRTTVTLAAQTKKTVLIGFNKAFLKFLGADTTIQEDTAAPVISYIDAGTTASMEVGVKSADGSALTQSQVVFWKAYGIV